jgi:hypothetical protein
MRTRTGNRVEPRADGVRFGRRPLILFDGPPRPSLVTPCKEETTKADHHSHVNAGRQHMSSMETRGSVSSTYDLNHPTQAVSR